MVKGHSFLVGFMALFFLAKHPVQAEQIVWYYRELKLDRNFSLTKTEPRKIVLPDLIYMHKVIGTKNGSLLLLEDRSYRDSRDHSRTDTLMVKITSGSKVAWSRRYRDRSLLNHRFHEGSDGTFYFLKNGAKSAAIHPATGNLLPHQTIPSINADELAFFDERTKIAGNRITGTPFPDGTRWLIDSGKKKNFPDGFIEYDESVYGFDLYRVDRQGKILARQEMKEYRTTFDLTKPDHPSRSMAPVPSLRFFVFSRKGRTKYETHLAGSDHSLYLLSETMFSSSNIGVQHLMKFTSDGRKVWDNAFSYDVDSKGPFFNHFTFPFMYELEKDGEKFLLITGNRLYEFLIIDSRGRLVKEIENDQDLPECCVEAGIKESSSTGITFALFYYDRYHDD